MVLIFVFILVVTIADIVKSIQCIGYFIQFFTLTCILYTTLCLRYFMSFADQMTNFLKFPPL